MHRLVVPLLLISILLIGGGGGAVYALDGNMTFQERNQLFLKMSKPNELSGGNYFIMILKTPSGPELDNFVINATDLDKLKNNVGVFTVCGAINNGLCEPPVFTQSQPTNDYCQLATLIHLNEDGYDNKPVGNSTIFVATTPPSYCSIQSVPEFPASLIVLLTISASMTLAVIFGQKFNRWGK